MLAVISCDDKDSDEPSLEMANPRQDVSKLSQADFSNNKEVRHVQWREIWHRYTLRFTDKPAQAKRVAMINAKTGICQNNALRSAAPAGWSGKWASRRENPKLKSP